MELGRQLDENQNPLTGPQKARKRKETSRRFGRQMEDMCQRRIDTNNRDKLEKWRTKVVNKNIQKLIRHCLKAIGAKSLSSMSQL